MCNEFNEYYEVIKPIKIKIKIKPTVIDYALAFCRGYVIGCALHIGVKIIKNACKNRKS